MSKKTNKNKANLEVIYRPVADLKPDPRNANVHPADQVAQLRASIKEFGFTQPILLRPSGMIGAGHGRWEAAKLEGIKEVPTITLNLTAKQWRAYAIADNQIPKGATWDIEILRSEVMALEQDGTIGLAELGFGGLPELQVQDGEQLEESGGVRAPGQAQVQFNIVFDDVDQQQIWFDFVKKLKAKWPDAETLGARLALALPKVKL